MEALDGQLDAGRRALEQARWDDARRCFEAVLAAGESAPGREGLGLALWFLGRSAEGIAARSRAFDLYARAGRCDEAARSAVWVAHQHHLAGRASAARGWLSRAERVLDGAAEGEGHGWTAMERARQARHLEVRVAEGERAVRIAQRCGVDDLEVFALSLVGRAQVEAGRPEEGLRLLEEAMAGASDGRVRNVHTLAETYCNLILATTGAGDWARAVEWCEHVDAFARANDAAPLFASCRGVHADVLLATGHWSEAEQALETALATHAEHVPEMGAPSVACLAELRIVQGRLAEAEVLLADRPENPAALLALARLRMAEARPDAALALLERGLRHDATGVTTTARLLATLVDARTALGDLPGARVAVADLVALAKGSGLRLVTGRAELAAARLVRGEGGSAADHARRALVAFLDLAMPLEAGEARIELAHALAREDAHEAARDEAAVALAVFRRLGAVPHADLAAALLRDLGPTAVGGSRDRAPLTPREEQVLELVARGYSNARIASSLVISEKTAGHHVSHILTKLGVRNRTAAAAHARSR